MHHETNSGTLPISSTPTEQNTPCRYFYRSGRCRRGDKCRFSHSSTRKPSQPCLATETPSVEVRLSAQAVAFTPGTSSRSNLSASVQAFQPVARPGNNDNGALQGVASERQSPSASSSKPKPKPIMKGVAASVGSPNTARCDICMEVPTVYAQHINCNHLFCCPCLKTWRKQRSQAKSKNCPTCRTPSDFTFVTPQPFTDGARTLALQRFRQRAADTPCKNFTKSLGLSNKRLTKPFCMFGDDCLYKHEMDGKEYKVRTREIQNSGEQKGDKTDRRLGCKSSLEGLWAHDFLLGLKASRGVGLRR